MQLKQGFKFIQDGTINCEVIEIYTEQRKTSKNIVKTEKIKINKNGKEVVYDLDCFKKSFDVGLTFGSFKI